MDYGQFISAKIESKLDAIIELIDTIFLLL